MKRAHQCACSMGVSSARRCTSSVVCCVLSTVIVASCYACRVSRSSFSADMVSACCFCCARSTAIVSSCCVCIAAMVSSWRRDRVWLSDRMNGNPPAITNVCSTPATICPMPTQIASRLISNSASCTASVSSCMANVAF